MYYVLEFDSLDASAEAKETLENWKEFPNLDVIYQE